MTDTLTPLGTIAMTLFCVSIVVLTTLYYFLIFKPHHDEKAKQMGSGNIPFTPSEINERTGGENTGKAESEGLKYQYGLL